jgi:head-tail adaptor
MPEVGLKQDLVTLYSPGVPTTDALGHETPGEPVAEGQAWAQLEWVSGSEPPWGGQVTTENRYRVRLDYRDDIAGGWLVVVAASGKVLEVVGWGDEAGTRVDVTLDCVEQDRG